MRRPRPAGLARGIAVLVAAAGLAGCAAEGSTDADVVVHHHGVPFSYEVPAGFTPEEVDHSNSRGEVVGLRALDKVNVVAVRRLPPGAVARTTRLRVLGEDVTSRVTPVAGHLGWGLECQFTEERRGDVLDACRTALRTIQPAPVT